MRKLCLCLILFIYVFIQIETLWIGEEYWTIIDQGGNLRNGRTSEDFIRFKGPNIDEFVAYWIINHDSNQFEAYGEAYYKNNGSICGRFIDENDETIEICGGFRILSNRKSDNSNPFEWYAINKVPADRTVEYVHHQIARVWHDFRQQSIFGGAHLNRGLAYAVNLNGTSLHIIRDSDPYFYESNVELLVIRDGYTQPLMAQVQKKRCRHRHGPIVTPDDLTQFNVAQNPRPASFPAAAPLNPNECQSVQFDLNGDGFIDAQELHACRYGKIGCAVSIYDVNHDGYLDFDELEECKKVLKSDKYVRYCSDLYFDLDKNGYVDSFELEKCLNRHDPTRRREIRAIRAKKHLSENNEANEFLKEIL